MDNDVSRAISLGILSHLRRLLTLAASHSAQRRAPDLFTANLPDDLPTAFGAVRRLDAARHHAGARRGSRDDHRCLRGRVREPPLSWGASTTTTTWSGLDSMSQTQGLSIDIDLPPAFGAGIVRIPLATPRVPNVGHWMITGAPEVACESPHCPGLFLEVLPPGADRTSW